MKIDCRVFNDELGLDLTVILNPELVTAMFLPEITQQKSGQFVAISKNIQDWISAEDDLFKPFVTLSDFVHWDPNSLLNFFLVMIAREDKRGYKLLCRDEYKKDDFLKKFRKYQKSWFGAPHSTQLIAPDILLYTLCYIQYHETNQTSIEVPQDLIPYIINIEGVEPDLNSVPDGFDPDLPYEADEVELEKTGLFDKFPFLRKKSKN